MPADRLSYFGFQNRQEWRAFEHLAAQLRCALIDGADGQCTELPWDLVAKLARQHSVTPTLAWCARQNTTVPPALAGYFDAVLRLNGKRNARICDTFAQLVSALNAIDVEPMPLKGAAHLVSELYPVPAARLLGDLDILVPQPRLADVVAAMEKIGFSADPAYPGGYKHLPPLHHDAHNIAIEVHGSLLHRPDAEPIVADAFIREHARLHVFRGARVRMPSPTLLVAHNVVHDQLAHDRYELKQVELRQLLDLALVRARHGGDIDWAELSRRFDYAGLRHVLATYLCYGEFLFGQTNPVPLGASPTQTIALLRAGIEARMREERTGLWSVLRLALRLAGLYVRQRAKDPAGLRRLLRPAIWRRQFREFRRLVARRI
jgi:hypothetical protein